jgi:hypothetical protein
VDEARRRGFDFWTNERINRWVRARRRVTIAGLAEDGRPIADHVPAEDGRVVVWVPVAPAAGAKGDAEWYGVPCRKFVLGE